MKRVLSLLLALVLLCTLALPAAAADWEETAEWEDEEALESENLGDPIPVNDFVLPTLPPIPTFPPIGDETGILVDALHFPDANFRAYIQENFGRTVLLTTVVDAETVTEIDCSGLGIADLRGVEYFTNLTSLDCSDNSLTSLDLSSNTLLRALYCEGNAGLSSLDVQAIPALLRAVQTGERVETAEALRFTTDDAVLCIPPHTALTGFYTVRFALNGGVGEIPSQTVPSGGRAVCPDIEPEREGFWFWDWYAGSTEGEPYDWESPVTGDLTLTAGWAKIVIVTLDYAGGTVNGESGAELEFCDRMNLRYELPTPVWAGHYFNGWLLDGEPYDLDATLSGDLTLTADWLAAWSLHFDRGNPHDNQARAIEDLTIPAGEAGTVSFWYDRYGGQPPLLQDDGAWQFLGWDTDPNAAPDAVRFPRYENGAEKPLPGPYAVELDGGDVTLYAIYGLAPTITVMKNDGSDGAVSGVVRAPGVYSWIMLGSKPTRSGYDLLGFSTDPNAAAPDPLLTRREIGKTNYVYYYATEDTTLYAVWAAKQYTLSFDLNGGEGELPESLRFSLDNKPEIVLPTEASCAKEHRSLLGWAVINTSNFNARLTDVDYGRTPSGTVYAPGEILPAAALKANDLTVYAVWQYEAITVSLDLGGYAGSYPTANSYPMYYNYGADKSPNAAGAPTGHPATPNAAPGAKAFPEGFTGMAEDETANAFCCWQDQDGACYPTRIISTVNNGTALLPNDRDTVLRAVWRYSFVRCLDADGALAQLDAIVMDPASFTVLNKLTVPEGPERRGWEFLGWALEENGAVVYQPGDTLSEPRDLTLWPVFRSVYYVENPVLSTAPGNVPEIAAEAGKTLFCGYYYDEAYTQPVLPGDENVAGAYAKYVAMDVLNIAVQIRQETLSAVEGASDIRLVTSVPAAQYYDKVGFVLTLPSHGDYLVSDHAFSSPLYDAIYAGGKRYDLDQLHRAGLFPDVSDSAKIALQTVTGFPARYFADGNPYLFKVQAYLITRDGTTVYGQEKYFKLGTAENGTRIALITDSQGNPLR